MPVEITAEAPFVGRVAELDLLEKGLRLTAEEHGRLHLLVGEPGIGETRLAEEFAARARTRGITVLAGRCPEDAGAPLYWAWAQAVEPVLRSLKPRALASALDGRAPLVAMVFPVLRALLPDLKPYSDMLDRPEETRFRMLDAVAGLLARISSDSPLLIVLDDLHWADEGTLKVLLATARELGRCHLMLVGTYRDVELSRKHPLARMLGELARERLYERHALAGLSEEEVRAYCAAALPGLTSAEMPRAVRSATEGNPLFVAEMVQELAHLGVEKLGSTLPRLPEGVREAIGRRLDRLSAPCDKVLGVAAVMGIEVGRADLAKATEAMGDAEVLGAIEEARSARILEESTDRPGRYRFTHALVREALLAELSLRERVRIHARVAEVLAASFGEDAPAHAAELLGHFEQAASILGTQKLGHYALLAAEQALAACAYEDALRFARRGLAALQGCPMDDGQAALCVAMARAVSGVDHHNPEALSGIRKAFDYYRATGQAERAVGLVARILDYAEGGTELYREALEIVPKDSQEAGLILARLGSSLAYREAGLTEATCILSKALAIARKRSDLALELRVLRASRWIDWFHHRLAEPRSRCAGAWISRSRSGTTGSSASHAGRLQTSHCGRVAWRRSRSTCGRSAGSPSVPATGA